MRRNRLKTFTIVQVLLLAMLAVYGATAGADHGTACTAKPVTVEQSCTL